jgi:hypothetical protein
MLHIFNRWIFSPVVVLSSYLPVKETLHDFLQHLNGIHTSIKFTTELEQNGTLPISDVQVKKNTDGTISHTAYKKTKHMDLNLQVDPYNIIWHKKSSPLYSHPPCTNHSG